MVPYLLISNAPAGAFFVAFAGRLVQSQSQLAPSLHNIYKGGMALRRGKEIIGLPVIDLSSGQRVAEVKDLVCDQSEQRITALIVGRGNLWRKAKIITWESIYSVGTDAVTIASSNVIAPAAKLAGNQHTGNRYLGKQVLTTSGQYLGRVDDIAVNQISGQIVGCVLTDGIVGDFISGRAIIPLVESAVMSADNMIVPDEPVDLSYEWGVRFEGIEMSDVQ